MDGRMEEWKNGKMGLSARYIRNAIIHDCIRSTLRPRPPNAPFCIKLMQGVRSRAKLYAVKSD